MLTYDQLAKELGIPRGTLAGKIHRHNARCIKEGRPDDQIKADAQKPTTSVQHLFKPERVNELRDRLGLQTKQRRGRPRKTN